MLKSYLNAALRNLKKNRIYSFIHIIGLMIGVVCLTLILRYVRYEMSFDRFNKKADQIYRLTGFNWAQTPAPISAALREFYPEIQNTVRIKTVNKVSICYNQKKFYEERTIFSDPSIFKTFSFPLIKGDPDIVLNDPYSVVISKDMAQKYFGKINPVGKTLIYDDKYNFTVTGIAANIPNNSHLKFDFVFSLKCADQVFNKDFFENRINTVVFNYFLLNKNSSFLNIKDRLDDFTKYYLGEEEYNFNKHVASQWRIGYQIQPLTSIHLHSNLGGELETNGDITNVYIFSIIGLLILLIACINYMNLSTARYMVRLKEIGIRKVIGANRSHIIYQFIGESVLISFFSIFIAVIIIELISPWLGTILNKKEIFASNDFESIFILAGIALCTGLVSGLYPALFLSRFPPIQILSKTLIKTKKRLSHGNIFLVFQFVISCILIIATIIVSSQLSYIQNKKLGFNKERIVVIPLYDISTQAQYKVLKDELLQQSGILGITASSVIPGNLKWVRSFWWDDQNYNDDNTMCYIAADEDFLKTYQIKIAEGRDFSESLSTDSSAGFLINEAALSKLGWKSPTGKSLGTFGKQGKVIGVIKDFHFKSLHEKIQPLVIYYDSKTFEFLSVKIKSNNIPEVLSNIQKSWKALFPDKPYEFNFLDEQWGKLYNKEQETKNLFSVFSGLAIFIACLGLFGLALFNTQNKTKEIGIRKAMGASISNVALIFIKNFLILILISNVIAWPIAYFFMNKWLQDFAYRIDISWWMFVLSGGIALIIALATVSFQAIKAATANPVESLRYE
ncbi:MAG TPA: FtsX-like permease family protein [Ignavibacteriaceae bacterium]|nr:FtsX-like permease family protein [Ignavibacteriaceae bacterium]